MPKCPICRKATARRSSAIAPSAAGLENRAFPFCSARCKMVDLGKWLSEEYRVPVDEEQGMRDDQHERDERETRYHGEPERAERSSGRASTKESS